LGQYLTCKNIVSEMT